MKRMREKEEAFKAAVAWMHEQRGAVVLHIFTLPAFVTG
jgi:hypothetical protein